MSFDEFFKQATCDRPYPYQRRFAEDADLPHLVQAPTGAGKTATAILGWLYRRHKRPAETPRRLVYCLPMRVLVEQTAKEAVEWIENLKLDVPVHVLMGGVEAASWELHPERPAVLIGTQDMLLSRALNRGYGASRFHWPIDFAWLNSDCLWVFDEPQLMGAGVGTSAQLAGLRQSLGTHGPCRSVWMSATLERTWLDTVDFAGKLPADPLDLQPADYDETLPLHKKMTAAKTLTRVPADTTDAKELTKAVAKHAFDRHVAGTQTLVILNTVDRAKAVHEALNALCTKSPTPPNLLLVHSRFRPQERKKLNGLLKLTGEATRNRILVATQVVEAGVDISSRTLVTELCPWPSAVQRMGRNNRTGDDGPGQVFWVDTDPKFALPYELPDLQFAREMLTKLEGQDVSPKSLADFKDREKFVLKFEHKHVLRRRDLLDLFDTTADLSGNDIDVARFVRSDEPSTDVQVFWRVLGDKVTEDGPARDELCTVPVGVFRDFVKALPKDKPGAYTWDHLDGVWVKLDHSTVRPGLVVLLPTTAGGYTDDRGWDSGSTVAVVPVKLPPKQPPRCLEETRGDPVSISPAALSIAQHTANVVGQLQKLLDSIKLEDPVAEAVRTAALWHDVGKAHWAFQEGMRSVNKELGSDKLWAKSGTATDCRKRVKHGRKYFRHELASALAMLQARTPFLAAYVVAAHHGKVRLGIRSLPGEEPPEDNPKRLFALGVHDGDPLPEVVLDGDKVAATKLDLSPMRLGGDGSWTARALQLLAEFGPFRLAYFEALLRAADEYASEKEKDPRG